MIVIPAIDLMGGKVVRLEQGDAARVTTFHGNPVRLTTDFARSGAPLLHVVDLDGAFSGQPQQIDLIAKISDAAQAHGAVVQAGGGLRDVAAVETLLATGVAFVVVGTLAVREPDAVERLCKDNPGRIVVAADARDGMVAVEAWTKAAPISARALAESAERWGAAAVLFTDVERDGTKSGPAVAATVALQRGLSIPVYASGGVGRLADLDACVAAGIQGVVLGRALYEGAFTFEEALARC